LLGNAKHGKNKKNLQIVIPNGPHASSYYKLQKITTADISMNTNRPNYARRYGFMIAGYWHKVATAAPKNVR
jgi:hypothetical protein